jgi:hypothetical protein
MEYLQRALERIIPDHRQIAEEAIRGRLFAPSLFSPATLDASQCLFMPPGPDRVVAFLSETAGGRRLRVQWMEVVAGQPSAVLAPFIGHIEYIPAGAFYHQDYQKLREGIAAAARGFARRVNRDLLRLLCAAGRQEQGPTDRQGVIIEDLIDNLRATGHVPRVTVAPEAGGPVPDEIPLVTMARLRRVVVVDTSQVGLCGGSPLRVLLGAHTERNAYWIIVGCYLAATMEDPAAVGWARVK